MPPNNPVTASPVTIPSAHSDAASLVHLSITVACPGLLDALANSILRDACRSSSGLGADFTGGEGSV
ncbi:hypothetical protein AXF42_Ash009895 [Apostasia shenzhenica]|uniref:Uncharacterized protein n=1 Tax=Apostasia shenzhenica TaxID=1088818 RepID=A0A2I0ACC6_9ASPA|nr:hypothetical protein AXF42_Ash009895 [Apostasia shenzhenica]